VAGATYDMSVYIGNRTGGDNIDGYTVGLYSGGVLLQQRTHLDFKPAEGSWGLLNFSYTAPAASTGDYVLDRPLEIRLTSSGVQTSFDEVSLNASKVTGSTALAITNPSFEGNLNGWTVTGNMTTFGYIGGASPTAGNSMLLANTSGTVSQALTGQSVQADTLYTLAVDLMSRTDSLPADGYLIELYAGVTLLSSDNNSINYVGWPGTYQYRTSLVTYARGTTNLPTGDLTIKITGTGTGGQEWFDNVRLWSTPIPEPGTVALLGMGGLGVLLRRRRR